jgi:hypothetical protein
LVVSIPFAETVSFSKSSQVGNQPQSVGCAVPPSKNAEALPKICWNKCHQNLLTKNIKIKQKVGLLTHFLFIYLIKL